MTRKQATNFLPILQAFAEGKHIQWRPHLGGGWCEIDSVLIFQDDCEYRIQPEPFEIWLRVCDNNFVHEFKDKPFHTLGMPENHRIIHVREVNKNICD